MSEDEETTYCRLCAEPTPITQLIPPEDDVALNSKIVAKMLWINIDVAASNVLPNSICYSCFDALERTWSFLNNVRTAQTKLIGIYTKKFDNINEENINKFDTGKPVDKDWDEFNASKLDVKYESFEDNEITLVDPSSVLKGVKSEEHSSNDKTLVESSSVLKGVKRENHSREGTYNDEIMDPDYNNSTDSDLPLRFSIRKKKRKKNYSDNAEDVENEIDLTKLKTEVEAEEIDISSLCLTWENYMCRCVDCDALCKNIASLRIHSLEIHACCCMFKCSDCGKVIANYKLFVNHVRYHNKSLRNYCEICNKYFAVTAYLKKHRNSEHADITTCENCGSSFETEGQLQDHILVFGKNLQKQRKREKTTSKGDIKCEHCNKEFKSWSNLQQHKLVHTERSRNFFCHVCGKTFFTKGTLGTHMATHEDTKPYKCEFCPMAFRARGNLQSHISLHSGAKPFVCEQCGKSFRVKRHLKSHSIVHTDLMPYVCQFCNKSFRFKTRLNLHVRQHTGAKPYTCIFCQRDFTNGSNYKKHMKRRHNIDTSKKRFNVIVDEQGIPVTDNHSNDS